MSVDIDHIKYYTLNREDYESHIQSHRHYEDIWAKVCKMPPSHDVYPPWELGEYLNNQDILALQRALADQGVEWDPEVDAGGEPFNGATFGNWAGSRHFARFFVETFEHGAVVDVNREALMEFPGIEDHKQKHTQNIIFHSGLLSARILPLTFPGPILLDTPGHPDWTVGKEDDPGTENSHQTLALNMMFRPLYQAPLLSAPAVLEWIARTADELHIHQEIAEVENLESQIREVNKKSDPKPLDRKERPDGKTIYVDQEGNPVSGSFMEHYDELQDAVIAVQERRPEVDVAFWRLALLKQYIEHSQETSYAVSFM